MIIDRDEWLALGFDREFWDRGYASEPFACRISIATSSTWCKQTQRAIGATEYLIYGKKNYYYFETVASFSSNDDAEKALAILILHGCWLTTDSRPLLRKRSV
jgi:hypothetical protein